MFYDRKVKYFDYIKNGERLHGAGFAKMEVRDNKCRLQLQLSGMQMMDNFTKQVYLLSADREELLCNVELQGGRGMVQKELSADNLCGGISYEAMQAIRVPIAAGCELLCKIQNTKRLEREIAEQCFDTVQHNVAVVQQDMEAEKHNMKAKWCDVEVEQQNEEIEQQNAEVEQENVEMEQQNAEVEQQNMEESQYSPQAAQQIMLASKWEQLSAIYPHIKPFGDERDYLKLGPEDFVVLGTRSYQLVHNSFLLHGYYNYRHLILARHEWRNEARYYIGVPGNFYEREKQVALMFGFESFECKQEPADNGTYGYYMIGVDL